MATSSSILVATDHECLRINDRLDVCSIGLRSNFGTFSSRSWIHLSFHGTASAARIWAAIVVASTIEHATNSGDGVEVSLMAAAIVCFVTASVAEHSTDTTGYSADNATKATTTTAGVFTSAIVGRGFAGVAAKVWTNARQQTGNARAESSAASVTAIVAAAIHGRSRCFAKL